MQRAIDKLEFVQGVQFEVVNSLKSSGTDYLLFLMTHVQKFATLRSLQTSLPLADNADLVLYTLNTIYSAKVN